MTTHTEHAGHAGHTDVHTLVHRLFRALDARDFTPGWMDAFVTADASMETPLGTSEGAEAAARGLRS
jgi:hypothetical protein